MPFLPKIHISGEARGYAIPRPSSQAASTFTPPSDPGDLLPNGEPGAGVASTLTLYFEQFELPGPGPSSKGPTDREEPAALWPSISRKPLGLPPAHPAPGC